MLEGRHARASSAIPRRVTRDEVEPHADPLPRPGDGRADDRGRRGRAQGRATRSAASSTCAVRGCPPGWGEPVFDRLEADLAKAMLSLPASKGFEIGSGFAGTDLTGCEHNDEFYMDGDRVRTRTNRSRRRAGRHHQRRDDLLPRRVQADGDDHARAAHRRRRATRRRRITGARPPRSLRAAARGARWSRRWPRWCSPTTRSGTRRWPAARQRPSSVRHRMPHRDDVVLAALSGLFRLDRASLNSPRALLSFAEPGGAGG